MFCSALFWLFVLPINSGYEYVSKYAIQISIDTPLIAINSNRITSTTTHYHPESVHIFLWQHPSCQRKINCPGVMTCSHCFGKQCSFGPSSETEVLRSTISTTWSGLDLVQCSRFLGKSLGNRF
jgi:hypothetical protein